MDKVLAPEDVSKLSKDEKEILLHINEQLKSLTATPRSDWHAAIEADFRLDARYAEGGSEKLMQNAALVLPNQWLISSSGCRRTRLVPQPHIGKRACCRDNQ